MDLAAGWFRANSAQYHVDPDHIGAWDGDAGWYLVFSVPYKQNPDLWKSGSPTAYVKAGDLHIFITHGDSDKTAPLVQTPVFDAALTNAGGPHQFIIIFGSVVSLSHTMIWSTSSPRRWRVTLPARSLNTITLS